MALADDDGVVTRDYEYDPYGAELGENNSQDVNPYRYSGEYTDFETGYIYLRARYYDPSIGRFINEDMATDGYNWYIYCNGNPIMYTDPSGMLFEKIGQAWNSYWDNWKSGIDILKDSGTGGRIFASYSEGVVYKIKGQFNSITNTVQHPIQTIKNNVTDFRYWESIFNPGTSIGRSLGGGIVDAGKDVYNGDWESLAYKAGDLTVEGVEIYVTAKVFKAIEGKLTAPKAAAKPIGKPLDLNGPKIQMGVDPNTIKPVKNLSRLNPSRLSKVEQLVREGKVPDSVTVNSQGFIQQGHHRTANAIKYRRGIDVIFE